MTDTEKQPEEGQLTLDIFQTEDHIMIQSTIAGVSRGDIDISITNDMVTIRGERKKGPEIKAANYFYEEVFWGPFSRSVILPEEVDEDGAVASIKNGILTIKLPKKLKTKKIRIE
jgi:HSP20 family protein